MCDDCQAYARYLKREDLLDSSGGTEIFQLRPEQIKITVGLENLQCIKLSPKGLLRWYTGCCNTPVSNMSSNPKMPFAGMEVSFMNFQNETIKNEVLGPVVEKVFGKFSKGIKPLDASEKASLKLIFKIIFFLISGYFKKRESSSLFFNITGGPIIKPSTLTREEVFNLKHQ